MKHILLTSAAAALAAAAGPFIIPEPSGPYRVQLTHTELIDTSRPDPFEPSSQSRRLMISRLTPIPRSSCPETCLIPYMPPATSASQDSSLALRLGGTSFWPAGQMSRIRLTVCCSSSSSSTTTAQLPTILFAPGYNTTRHMFHALLSHVAAEGYEVITMDHPHEASIVEFPDGTVVPYSPGAVAEQPPLDIATGMRWALDVRGADARFVLHASNVSGPVLFAGMSFGGAAVADALVGADAERFAGGVSFDGSLWGPAVTLGSPLPFLLAGRAGHSSKSGTDASWTDFVSATLSRGSWLRELSVEETVHFSFTDYSVLADLTGLRGEYPAETAAALGAIRGERMAAIWRGYLDAFAGKVLSGKGDGILEGESKTFPEVGFVV